MKDTIIVVTKIEELRDYAWLSYILDTDECVQFVCDGETIANAAKRWGMTKEAVTAIKEAFDYFAETLIDHLMIDLQDIWEATKENG
jgi:hypothetical protein